MGESCPIGRASIGITLDTCSQPFASVDNGRTKKSCIVFSVRGPTGGSLGVRAQLLGSEGDVMRKQWLPLWLAVGVCLVTALPAVMASAAGALAFTPPVHYGLGGRPADLASADLNGDGRPDIVASAGAGIDILLGSGRGRFAAAIRMPLEHRPGAIALADADRSGTLDVVTANADDTVSVLLGDGRGSFVAWGAFPTGASPSDLVVGDLTGDGVPDVATAGGDGLSILTGDGSGGLLSPVHLAVGEGCRHVVIGDFNLDGTLDLAFTRNSWEEYSGFGVLLGDGAGGFSPLATYSTYLEPFGLAMADLNLDGRPDLVSLDGLEGDAEIGAFLGDGMGVFISACRTMFSRNLSASGLAVGDLNRDGRADVVTTGRRPGHTTGTNGGSVTVPPGPPRIYILLSHSFDGVFFEPTSFLAGRVPGEVIVADFNGDHKPDLATTDVETKSLSVRLNGALPALTGVSPVHGRIGDVVTLTGRHFGKRGVVQFSGKTVTAYLSWDVSQIKVRVPRGTARGSVKVTVTTLIGQSAPRSFFRL